MEARNVIHLYFGCEAMVTYDHSEYDFKVKLVGIDHEGNPLGIYEGAEVGFGRYQTIENGKLKLLLRPLSSMTEEEAEEMWYMDEPKHVLTTTRKGKITVKVALCSERTKWLLSKHFDLFGLIEKGEAIDSTKL